VSNCTRTQTKLQTAGEGTSSLTHLSKKPKTIADECKQGK
jgi:hypothetical protein